jgi:hypothetical protein
MEAAAARTLVGVRDGFDTGDGFLGQMVELEEHRAVAALEIVVELPHHLATPVIALR